MSEGPGDRARAGRRTAPPTGPPTGRPGRRVLQGTWAAGAVLLALVACGGGDSGSPPGGGVHLEMRHSEPLRARGPVRWTLVVNNGTAGAKTLVFSSGQDGDVVLRQGGQERYRWSTGRAFTQAIRRVSVPAQGSTTFVLEEERLDVAPGEYEAVASLAADDPPGEVRKTVVVGR